MPSEPDRRSTAFASSSVPENYERLLVPVLFRPWAEILLDSVAVQPGDRILDVASGTGVVARLAAARAGVTGSVVASDVSAAMLAHAASVPAAADAAPIERLEAPVTELPLDEDSFDVVLCQQGMPFFTDRPAATSEMHRVLRPGGTLGVSVWVTGRRLEPFEEYNEALVEAGAEPPFPGAFNSRTFQMEADELRAALDGAGLASVELRTVEYEVIWPDAEAAAEGIQGTPFAPLVERLSPDRRDGLHRDLLRRFGAAGAEQPVRRTTAALVATATAP
jgi:ubiquinone/menaquinone biosynthesis C-methylase UbiE